MTLTLKRKLIAFVPYFALFLFSLFPYWLNSFAPDPNGIFNLRDFDMPYDIQDSFNQKLLMWNPQIGLGYPNFGSFEILVHQAPLLIFRLSGMSLLSAEKSYLTGILFLLGACAYYFLNNFLTFNRKWPATISAILGALFYMYNIPLFHRFVGVPHSIIAVALFPLLLVYLDKIVCSSSFASAFKYAIYFILLSPFLLGSDPTIAYMYCFTFLFFVSLSLVISRERTKLKVLLSSALIIVIGTLLVNSFWMLPVLADYLKGGTFVEGTVEAVHNNEVFLIAQNLSNSPLDIIRLHWTKDGFDVLSALGTFVYPSWIRDYYHLPISTLLFLALIGVGTVISFKNKENTRQVTILTAIGLVGIFFTLGLDAPLSFWKIHLFLFKYFPGFTVLRNFFKFQLLQLFWYVSLLTFTSYWLLTRKTAYRLFTKIFITLFLLLFIAQGAIPWFGKNLSGRFEFFVLPDYYYQAKSWLDSQGKDFRFIVFPQGAWTETYEWGPELTTVPLYRNFFNQPSLYLDPVDASKTKDFVDKIDAFKIKNLPEFLKLFSVKYVLFRTDLNQLTSPAEQLQTWEEMPDYLEGNGFVPVASFENKLTFYENKNLESFPRIYSPETVIYSQGNRKFMDLLPELMGVEDKFVFLTSAKERGEEEALDISEKRVLVQAPEDEEVIEDSEISCEKHSLPFVRIFPSGVEYKLIRLKEILEKLVTWERKELLQKKILFSSKRIAELVGWGDRIPVERWQENAGENIDLNERLISYPARNEVLNVQNIQESWESLLSQFAIGFNEAMDLANEISQKQAITCVMMKDLNELQDFITTIPDIGERQCLRLLVNVIMDNSRWVFPSLETKGYKVNMEVEKEGIYQALIRNDELLSSLFNNNQLSDKESLSVVVNKHSLAPVKEGEWLNFGRAKLEKGTNEIEVKLSEINLTGEDWLPGEDEVKYPTPGFITSNVSVLRQSINNWKPENYYLINFDYFTDFTEEASSYICVAIREKVTEKDLGSYPRLITKDLLNFSTLERGRWLKYQNVVKANPAAEEAEIIVISSKGGKIKNLKIVSAIKPEIYFIKEDQENTIKKVYRNDISFEQINPVKFKVTVGDTKKPFVIVFNDAFNVFWKVKISGKDIPNSRHFIANGYGNAWYLQPNDFVNSNSKEIYIEYSLQDLFSWGARISLIVYLALLMLAIVLLRKLKR